MNTVGKLLLESSKLRAECHWSRGRAGSRPQEEERARDSDTSPLSCPGLAAPPQTHCDISSPCPTVPFPGMLKSLFLEQTPTYASKPSPVPTPSSLTSPVCISLNSDNASSECLSPFLDLLSGRREGTHLLAPPISSQAESLPKAMFTIVAQGQVTHPL